MKQNCYFIKTKQREFWPYVFRDAWLWNLFFLILNALWVNGLWLVVLTLCRPAAETCQLFTFIQYITSLSSLHRQVQANQYPPEGRILPNGLQQTGSTLGQTDIVSSWQYTEINSSHIKTGLGMTSLYLVCITLAESLILLREQLGHNLL